MEQRVEAATQNRNRRRLRPLCPRSFHPLAMLASSGWHKKCRRMPKRTVN